MSSIIETIKAKLEVDGINTIPDNDPNTLFVINNLQDGTGFAVMMRFVEEANMMMLTAEIPVEFSVEKEDSAFLAAAYINRILSFGMATYSAEINRIVFRFYCNMEEECLNLAMFDYCFNEAVDLVKRFYPAIDLLEKGAVLPKDVIEIERNRI